MGKIESFVGSIKRVVHAYKKHSLRVEAARAARAIELAAESQARQERIAAKQAEHDAAVAKLFSPDGLQWCEFPGQSRTLEIGAEIHVNAYPPESISVLQARNRRDTIYLQMYGDSILEVAWQDNPSMVVAIYGLDRHGYVTTQMYNAASRKFEGIREKAYDGVIMLPSTHVGRYRYDGSRSDSVGISLDLEISSLGIKPKIRESFYQREPNIINSMVKNRWGIRTARAVVSF